MLKPFTLLLLFGYAGMAFAADPASFITPKLPKGVSYLHDVPIGKIDGVTLSMEIALPAVVNSKPRPALVAIHGGAWRKGNKNKFAGKIISFAKQGYVGVSLMYRLAPDYQFPAQVEDVKAGIRFLKVHHQQYAIDPDRIIAIGASAGGHLATMLGTTGNDDSFNQHGLWTDVDSSVFAVVNFSGPTTNFLSDFSINWSSMALFLGGNPKEIPNIARAAMPITYLDKNDPPIFIAHGDADKIVPVQMSRDLAKAYQALGIHYEYHELAGGGHSLKPTHPQIFNQSLEFIAQLLKQAEE
ncbi:alpha/beta hydrolase fold domain-containing protein [Neptunicella sp. SCSIO 80796]|uniref:alpha/beta hydrolase fold domain-containing protein n=1 Tax=Neptunicella plasticusilytica TaxID=3117012 RepID=UPI003A4DDB45